MKLGDPLLVLGIDPSLTGTGLVVLDQEAAIVDQALVTTDSQEHACCRMGRVVVQVKRRLRDHPIRLAVIEGTVIGLRQNAGDQVIGLNWLLRYELWKAMGEQVAAIAPSSLKAWAAGTGKAKKDQMLLKVFKRWGVEFEDHNLCDAYCLARAGLGLLQGELSIQGGKVRSLAKSKNKGKGK